MLVDLRPIADGCLLGWLSMLSCMLWRQRSQLNALNKTVNAQNVELGNKLATIERLTGYDALTGLRGQRWFETELAEALRGNGPVALIYIDLDGVKTLNNLRGHQYVDGVIRSAAMAIRAYAFLAVQLPPSCSATKMTARVGHRFCVFSMENSRSLRESTLSRILFRNPASFGAPQNSVKRSGSRLLKATPPTACAQRSERSVT